MPSELNILLTLLTKNLFGYASFQVVLQTTADAIPDYEYYQEPEVSAKYSKLLKGVDYIDILAVARVQVVGKDTP